MATHEDRLLSKQYLFPELHLESKTKVAEMALRHLKRKTFTFFFFFAAFGYGILCILNTHFYTSVLLVAVWDFVRDITKVTSSGNLVLLWFVQCGGYVHWANI